MQEKYDALELVIDDLLQVLDATRRNRLDETSKLLERALVISRLEVSARQ